MMDTNLTYRNPDYDYLNNIAAGMGQGNTETPINETHPKKQRNKKRWQVDRDGYLLLAYRRSCRSRRIRGVQ